MDGVVLNQVTWRNPEFGEQFNFQEKGAREQKRVRKRSLQRLLIIQKAQSPHSLSGVILTIINYKTVVAE